MVRYVEENHAYAATHQTYRRGRNLALSVPLPATLDSKLRYNSILYCTNLTPRKQCASHAAV